MRYEAVLFAAFMVAAGAAAVSLSVGKPERLEQQRLGITACPIYPAENPAPNRKRIVSPSEVQPTSDALLRHAAPCAWQLSPLATGVCTTQRFVYIQPPS